MSCVVVIPVYKSEPDAIEILSLKQCISILKKYDICLIKPEHLDISRYKKIFKADKKNFYIQNFDDAFFTSVQGYSELCLTEDLYARFSEYNYMFLYQLDGWVFRDELEDWCRKRYDYIGAPWFEGYSRAKKTAKFIVPSGNGGISLRHIKTFVDILKNNKRIIKVEGKKTSIYDLSKMYNEDGIIVEYFSKIYPKFRIAAPKVSMHFSFEVNPDVLYDKIGKLPFACHAFTKYNPDFWKKYIDLKNIRWPGSPREYVYNAKYLLFGFIPLLSIEEK